MKKLVFAMGLLVSILAAGAAQAPQPASAAPAVCALDEAAAPAGRTCYYACDTWTLYTTLAACEATCVSPCERVCF